ncbi:hypothetical protein IGI04_030341 [Brassica rapa subsp. trilocularis]|uniref:CCT domain-containing protein n=1 Tax=Brassica rapa subsp. trilocularis TaxID=1813537 RepID=A0ABQ7LQE8_BRACM|nr:hypothetical protein IGI04_030341 [Brassica rapa subsp. trilocularis]
MGIIVVGVKNGCDKLNIQNILSYEKALRRKERDVRRKLKTGRYAATKRATLGRYVATESLRSDRASRPSSSETTPVHAFSSNLQCYLPKTVASSVYDFRYSKSSIKLCGLIPRKVRSLSKEIVVNASSRKTAQRYLKPDSRPILRFLNQNPVNHSTVYAWSTRKDKCQVSADKYGSFEDNCEDRENGISPFLCYDGLRAEDCDSIRFSRLRVARTRNLADSSRAQAYTLYPGPLRN